MGLTLLVGCGKKSKYETSASYKKKMATQIYKGEKNYFEIEEIVRYNCYRRDYDTVAKKEYEEWEKAFVKYADFDNERFVLPQIGALQNKVGGYYFFTKQSKKN